MMDPADERTDAHLREMDEGWQEDTEEWARTERATDELRHNVQWMNVLHRIKYPKLYLPPSGPSSSLGQTAPCTTIMLHNP